MDSPRRPDFSALIAQLTVALNGYGIPFMLIGGQAVLVHGEPRLTQDIDVTLGVSPSRLDEVIVVCEELDLEVLPKDVEEFVRSTFVLPARHTPSGVRLDLIFSTTPYEAEAIARAVLVEVEGVSVPFASAEDLVIHKLFAGRPRDIEDAVGVVQRNGATMDWDYMNSWVQQFAEIPGREGLPDRLTALRGEMN
jgi:predicted nucleotidyltransferase